MVISWAVKSNYDQIHLNVNEAQIWASLSSSRSPRLVHFIHVTKNEMPASINHLLRVEEIHLVIIKAGTFFYAKYFGVIKTFVFIFFLPWFSHTQSGPRTTRIPVANMFAGGFSIYSGGGGGDGDDTVCRAVRRPIYSVLCYNELLLSIRVACTSSSSSPL